MGGRRTPLGNTEFPVEEIVERLRLSSTELVADVYALANRQLDVEDKRETNLNGKAVSLLSASGVSVTVTFALGGVLAQRPELLELLAPAGTTWRVVLALSYAAAVFFGILAGVLAVLALKISAYVTVAEPDVFGDELRRSDEEGACAGQARYRRYLTAHLWQIYRANFRKHERKARKILFGQISFLVFLTLLIPLGASMSKLLLTVKPPVSVQVVPVKCEDQQKPPQPAKQPEPATTPHPKPPPTGVPSTGRLVQGSVQPDRRRVTPVRGTRGK